MRYTILILAAGNPRARKIVAHHLAGNRNVSLSYAQSLLENVPVVYQTDVSKDDADATLKRLAAIGVQAKAVSAASLNAPPQEAPEEPAPKTPPQPPVSEERQTYPEKSPHPSPAISYVYKDKIAQAPRVKNADAKRTIALTGILMIVFIGAIIISLAKYKWQPRHQSPILSSLGANPTQPVGKIATTPMGSDGSFAGTSGRPSISGEDLQRSSAFVDSGKACNSANGAVGFYKMAISVNKFNVGAWYGLLAEYSSLGMEDEKREAEKAMGRIFGEEIFSASKIVERFGELVDAYATSDGTCHIEYRSRESKKDALVNETYLLVKALSARKDCRAFSFYARAGKGRGGVLAYIAAACVPETYRQYRSAAKITTFD